MSFTFETEHPSECCRNLYLCICTICRQIVPIKELGFAVLSFFNRLTGTFWGYIGPRYKDAFFFSTLLREEHLFLIDAHLHTTVVTAVTVYV